MPGPLRGENREFILFLFQIKLIGGSIVYLDHIKAKWSSRAKWGSYARWGSSAGWSSYDDGTSVLNKTVESTSTLFTGYCASRSEYTVTGRKVSLQRPMLAFWIHPMDLTSDDKHNMQLDTKHIPSPTVNDRLSSSFRLPVGVDIAYESDNMIDLSQFLLSPP